MARREPVEIVLGIRGADQVTRETRQTADQLDKLEGSAERAGRAGERMGRLFDGARRGLGAAGRAAGRAAAGAAAIVAGGAFIRLASDAGEVQSAFEVTFGAGSAAVQQFVDDTAALAGTATADIQSAVNIFGSFAKAAGIADDQVGSFATDLVGAANDIASFKNADPTQVMEDMQSALSGSIEPLRKYGIFMSDANLSAQAAAMGMGDTFSELSEGEKVMVRQAFIMANLGDAAGDLARTAESPANTFRFLAGRGEEAMTMIGQGLLPAVEALTPTMRDLATRGIAFITDHLPALSAWSARVGERLADMINDDLPRWWATLRGAIDEFRAGGIADVGDIIDTAVGGDGRWSGPIDRIIAGFQRVGELAGTARDALGGLVDRFRGVADSTSDAGPQLADLASTITGPLAVGMEAAESALPVINRAFEWMGDNADTIGPAVAAIAGGLLAMRVGGAAVNSALAPIGGLRGGLAAAQLATAGLNLTTTILSRTTAANTTVTNVNTGATLRQRAAAVASRIAQVATTVATRTWTAAQWLLNTAMRANPIGLVITAIGALVAALVYAWNNSETFRTVVTTAFQRVREWAETAFNWVRDNWQLLLAILTGPIGIAVGIIVTHWDTIRSAFVTAWNGVTSAFRAVRTTIDGIWDGIKSAAASAVNYIIDRINDVIRAANTAIDAIDRVTPGAMGNIGELPQVEFRAAGGPVRAGRPYVVGEDGPELMVPDRNGTVIPNGAGGFNGEVHLHITQQPGENAEQLGRRSARAFISQLDRGVTEQVAWT